MNTSGFPACCGANILTGFNGTKEEVEASLQRYKTSRTSNIVGIGVAMLNDGQKIMYHDTLEKCGFRLMINGAHNYNHDSRIYMYTFVHRPEQAEADLYPGSNDSGDF